MSDIISLRCQPGNLMILSECLEMRTGIWVQLYPEKAIKRVHTPDFPGGTDSKASVYNAGDPGSIPGLVRSPGEGNGSLLQYYCLENPMDRGAW